MIGCTEDAILIASAVLVASGCSEEVAVEKAVAMAKKIVMVGVPNESRAMHLGRVVRELRQQQHMTVTGLAKRAGMTHGAVSNIEAGRSSNPRERTVIKLADALGVPVGRIWPWSKHW